MEHSFCPLFPLTADLWATCQGRTLIDLLKINEK